MEKKRHGFPIPGPTEGDPGTAVNYPVLWKKNNNNGKLWFNGGVVLILEGKSVLILTKGEIKSVFPDSNGKIKKSGNYFNILDRKRGKSIR